MSKFVKELQLKNLRNQFDGVTDLLVVNVIGLDAMTNHQLRMDLRKKGIHLEVVKNTLAKRVLSERGLEVSKKSLSGTSAVAWGGEGIVELAKEITDWAKKIAKLEIKGGSVSGQAVDAVGVERLSKLPSRLEILGKIASLATAPAGRVVMLANAPGRALASQIKSIAEPKEEEAAPAA